MPENTDPLDPEMGVLPKIPQCEDCRFYLNGDCRHIELNKDREAFKKGASFHDATYARMNCELENNFIPKYWQPRPPKIRWYVRLLLRLAEKLKS